MIEEYVKIKNNAGKETHLRISMDYTLGGTNWYSHEEITRGYYLYAIPCELSNRGSYTEVSTVLGRGLKILLKPVARRSKKAEDAAIRMAEERKNELIAAVCERYGYEVEE